MIVGFPRCTRKDKAFLADVANSKGLPKAYYRIYPIGPNGHFAGVEAASFDTDDAAVQHAARQLGSLEEAKFGVAVGQSVGWPAQINPIPKVLLRAHAK
jgi:hypothetical protein